jgi:hypothetical protein
MRVLFFGLLLLLFFHLSVASNHRIKRFLNAEVHNRINVLEQSHNSHRDDTNWMRTVLFGTIIGFGLVSLLVTITIIYLCRRIRRHVQQVESPTLAAIANSGLSQLHPLMPPLMTLLQHQHHLVSSSSTQPPLHYSSLSPLSTNSIYPSPTSHYSTSYQPPVPALKF